MKQSIFDRFQRFNVPNDFYSEIIDSVVTYSWLKKERDRKNSNLQIVTEKKQKLPTRLEIVFFFFFLCLKYAQEVVSILILFQTIKFTIRTLNLDITCVFIGISYIRITNWRHFTEGKIYPKKLNTLLVFKTLEFHIISI